MLKLTLTLVAAALAPSLIAQVRPGDFPVKLVVEVQVGNKDLVLSLLSRELRSLRDVSIVDKGELYTLHVIGGEVRNGNGTAIGYAFAVAIVATTETGIPFFQDVGLYLGKPETRCQSIVASFDTQFLEPWRKRARETAAEKPGK